MSSSSLFDNEIDHVLDLEQMAYSEGFKEGESQSAYQQVLEGKEYGYQTGFQRALAVGYIKGLVQVWRQDSHKYSSPKFLAYINQLDSLISIISFDNDEAMVDTFELQLRKARNKLRLLANLLGETCKITNLDTTINEVGGIFPMSLQEEELW